MSEWKLFDGDVAYVSTAAFHEHRERVAHLEQKVHRPRLLKAESFVVDAATRIIADRPATNARVEVSDLGCGDGGLLQQLNAYATIDGWGYDFQPSNAAGWGERGVIGIPLDVFGGEHVIHHDVTLGQIVVMTEVLEHLTDPHAVVRTIARQPHVKYVVASSPHTENSGSHDECHAWAWDVSGYSDLFRTAGYDIIRHETEGMFQVVLAQVKR